MNNPGNTKTLKWLFALFMVSMGSSFHGQNVVGVEYFWDVDPGFGEATTVLFDVPSPDVISDLELSTSGLSSGAHTVYLRAIKEDGTYGIVQNKSIYIPRVLESAEYFWDTEPGAGNGTPVQLINDGVTVQVCGTVSTTGLEPGTHYLFVRSRSTDGVWSIPYRSTVQVEPNDVPSGCPGDFDYNGLINIGDLLIFLPQIGTEGDCKFDLTGDFAVNITDILILLGAYGNSCP